jgi:stress-induced morphogen
MSAAETSIADILRSKLTGPVTHLLVQDISGGCGSMYAIEVTAEDFRGKTMLKQQRMVNAALGDVIKEWHGVQIRTTVPEA